MKRTVILTGLLLSIGSYIFAATDPEILKIPSLKSLTEKIEVLNKQSATSSRSGAAEIQAKLAAVYEEYCIELKKQKELTSDAVLKTAIDKELQIVKEKQNISSTKQSK